MIESITSFAFASLVFVGIGVFPLTFAYKSYKEAEAQRRNPIVEGLLGGFKGYFIGLLLSGTLVGVAEAVFGYPARYEVCQVVLGFNKEGVDKFCSAYKTDSVYQSPVPDTGTTSSTTTTVTTGE